jgi:hypothetical protein
MWKNVNAISLEEKKIIKTQFIKSQVLDVLYSTSLNRLSRALYIVIMVVTMLKLPIVLAVSRGDVNDWIKSVPRFTIYLFLGSGLVGIAELYLFILYGKLWPRRDRVDAARRLGLTSLTVFAVALSGTSSCRDTSSLCEATFFSSAIAGALIIYSIVALSLMYICRTRYQRRSCSQFPLQLLAAALFRAISRIEGAGSRWALPDVRSRVMRDLDEAARIVRFYLFNRLKIADRYSQLWRDERARLISNSLYEKQLWLMTPMLDTRERLLKYLKRTFLRS